VGNAVEKDVRLFYVSMKTFIRVQLVHVIGSIEKYVIEEIVLLSEFLIV
jgi:hypothetical protein